MLKLALTLFALAANVLASPIAADKVGRPLGFRKRWDLGVKDPVANSSHVPTYRASSDFDIASFTLVIYQEYIELDLFEYGYNLFSDADFQAAGLTPADRYLLKFMADQEVGHAELVSEILPPEYPSYRCTYNYSGAFTDVRSFFEFNQRLTRWGESGVLGFLTLLDSRDSAHLLQQSIHTEARQQMIFRQYAGAQPMPVYFESGIPQPWAWTLLAPYIQSCPKNNTVVPWSNYPQLTVENGPTLITNDSMGGISHNTGAKLSPGDTISLTWEDPGKTVGPDGLYKTVKTGKNPKYAYFVSQLNGTKVELENINGNSATAKIPSGYVLPGLEYQALNGTGFVAITDEDTGCYTPYNLSMITNHMIAGPSIIVFG